MYYQLVGNHDRVVDGRQPGSEDESWTITGTGPGGVPFTLAMDDRFVSQLRHQRLPAAYPVADLVWFLSDLPSVDIDRVTVDGTVSDDATTWQVSSLQYRAGAGVEGGQAARGRARGRRQAPEGAGRARPATPATRTVPLTVDVPRRLAGSRGVLSLDGGGEQYADYWEATNLRQFLKVVATRRPQRRRGGAALGRQRSASRTSDTVESAPADKVVVRRQVVPVGGRCGRWGHPVTRRFGPGGGDHVPDAAGIYCRARM